MSNASHDEGGGWGNPPKHSRFKPGNSGNPKGRPAKPRGVAEAVARHLDRPMKVRVGGRSKRVSNREVLIHKLYDRALDGDNRAATLLLSYDMASRRHGQDPNASGTPALSDEEAQAILDAYVASKSEEGEP